MGIHSLSACRWRRIGLVALLGMTLTLVTITASDARSGLPGHAVAAKKKCKKKGKKSATAAKKKKCKKVDHVVLPAPGPLVRAGLSWSTFNEVDLHAYDASGNHSGWSQPGSSGTFQQGIPSAHHSGDSGGPGGGTESFTDDIYVAGGPSNREFSYIACLYEFTATDNYNVTFTGVSKGGTTTTLTLEGTPSDGADAYKLTVPGGPSVPNPLTVC